MELLDGNVVFGSKELYSIVPVDIETGVQRQHADRYLLSGKPVNDGDHVVHIVVFANEE